MTLFNTVLLTGCSEHISQGLSQILRTTGAARRVIGCDTHAYHPGELLFDDTDVIAEAGDPAFADTLADVARRHQADLVVPVFEAEIGLLVRETVSRARIGIPVLLPSTSAVSIGLDKLATARFLERHGIDHPWTQIAGESAPRALPCILKPRRGNGGCGVLRISDPSLADCYRRLRPDDLWQELLQPDDQEYTCGLFRSSQGEVRVMVTRRVWCHGKTSAGTVTRDRRIEEYLAAIAEGLELQGSINVQLRLTPRGPVAFEINPRFSGTVVFRHQLGFEDFLWSLQEARGLAPSPFRGVPAGARYFLGARQFCLPAPDVADPPPKPVPQANFSAKDVLA
jgi:carbamoyl-phosphate synthase large subunit